MKNIVITGTSRGIGLALVKAILPKKDMNVLGISTTGRHPLESARLQGYALDLEQETAIDAFAASVAGMRIDYLVNNAAILPERPDDPSINFQQLEKTFRINLFGAIRLTERLLPQMPAGAHVVNVASDWGSFSEPNFDAFQPHYKMSKAALNMYTRLLASRLEGRSVRVSSYDPGWVRTDMGGPGASRTAEAAAADLLDLLLSEGPSGLFWHKGAVREW